MGAGSTCARSIDGQELVELRRLANISSDDLLASKDALSKAKELRRDLVVLTDCTPADCMLSLLALRPSAPGTAQEAW